VTAIKSTEARIDEVADRIYRISTALDVIPGGLTFNSYLIDDDEPVGPSPHCGGDPTAPVADAAADLLGETDLAMLPAGSSGSGSGDGAGRGDGTGAAGGVGAGSAHLDPGTAFDPTKASLVTGDPRDVINIGGADLTRLAIKGDPFAQLKAPEKLDDDFDYSLYTYRFRDEPGYFRVDIRPRRSLRKLRTLPKDVVFLIDTSGSISKEWMAQITAGVGDALATLNKGDRFNIVLFKDKPVFFNADRIQPATADSIQAAREFLSQAKSSG